MTNFLSQKTIMKMVQNGESFYYHEGSSNWISEELIPNDVLEAIKTRVESETLAFKKEYDRLRIRFAAELAKKDVENKALINELRLLQAKILEWGHQSNDISFKSFFEIKTA